MSSESRDALCARIHIDTREFVKATDVLQDAVASYLGIGRTDLRCLDILDRGGPMTAGALAEASGLSTGAVTALIDRLERSGYALRIRDSADRRRVLVARTPRAALDADRAFERIHEESNALLEALSDEQLATIARYLEEGARVVSESVVHVRQLPRPEPATGVAK